MDIDNKLMVRFWKKVRKTPTCWEWTGSKDRNGYGRIKVTLGKTNIKAHRVSYEFHIGAIPQGMFVLHKCDNPKCVRPDHLFLGTNTDNVQDMLSKGRGNIGEKNPNARLTRTDVKRIRESKENGESLRCIAKRIGVSVGTVHAVIKGRTWKHVPK